MRLIGLRRTFSTCTIGRKGSGYIALYSQHPARWPERESSAEVELRADAPDNIWICEMGDEQRYTVLTGILTALPQEREQILDAETSRQEGRTFETSAPFLRWLITRTFRHRHWQLQAHFGAADG